MKPKLYRLLVLVLAVLASPIESRAVVIAHWTFDETSGLVAANRGGINASNAVWQNADGDALTWTEGLIGGAARLSGEQHGSHFFNVENIGADGATQLSYSVWIKPDLVQTGSGDSHFANKAIFTSGGVEVMRTAGPAANQFWGATWQATTFEPETAEYRFRVDATGNQTTSTIYDGTQTEPEWIHLAFTWDGTAGSPTTGGQVTRVYVNGEFDSTRTNVNASQILDGGVWQIGKDRNFAGRTFAGLIDDLVVWDHLLTDEDVAAIYEGGLNGIDAPTALLGDATAGDVNGDGLVNSEDFEIIRQNFWQSVSDRTDGDLTSNGFVSFFDYAQWKQAPKDPDPLVASQAVPEPSSLILLASAALLGCRRRIL